MSAVSGPRPPVSVLLQVEDLAVQFTRRQGLFGRAETVKTNYRKRYDAHSEAVGQYARRVGWSFLRHRTDHSPATALIGLYGAIGGARAQRGF